MGVDGKKINFYIEQNKKRKPDYLNVDQQEWEDALDGYHEHFSNAIGEHETTETYWSLIFFSAMAFCKGLEYAAVKAGTQKETFYPRY